MSAAAGRVARLWLVRGWRDAIAPAVTIAICFGIAFFALAAARRTQSAYPRLLDDVHTSTISVSTVEGYLEETNAAIAAVPEVASSRTYVGFDMSVLVDGRPDREQVFETHGTFDGRYFDQDRFIPTQGRAADPERVDEVVVNEFGAHRLGYRVGQRLDIGAYDLAKWTDPSFDDLAPPPERQLTVTIVGIGLWPDEVIQDDADRTARLLITPALSRELRAWVSYGFQGLVLRRGDADVPAFLDHLGAIVPLGEVEAPVASVDAAAAQRAVRPLSLIVGAFGVVAALAGTVLACQALSRSVRAGGGERRMLVAFGGAKRTVAAATMSTPFVAVVVGLAAAVGLAIAASPAAPLGPVRRVEVRPGVDLDATVLIGGAAVVALVLLAWSALAIVRDMRSSHTRTRARASGPSRATAGAGVLGPEASVGLHFALGRGERSPAARSALISATIAIVAVVTTATFVSSLARLLDEPAAFGWNFDAAIVSSNGYGNFDAALSDRILSAEDAVDRWSGVWFGAGQVDGETTPLIGLPVSAEVRPPLVRGRHRQSDDEIVLGEQTARAIGARIGDEVVLTGGDRPHRLRLVGTAVLPSIGKTHAERTSLGRGAIVGPSLVPGSNLDMFGNAYAETLGPNALFLRYAPDIDSVAELSRLRVATAPLAGFAGLEVLGVQRPAAIVTSGDVGAAPAVLTGVLALGATASLLIALGTSVRNHRRELGVLSALGFTGGQRAATVLWQSSTIVAVGIVVGLPAGTFAGRALWQAFARHVQVVSRPAAPWMVAALVMVSALLLANLLALGAARRARRLSVAETLRAGQ